MAASQQKRYSSLSKRLICTAFRSVRGSAYTPSPGSAWLLSPTERASAHLLFSQLGLLVARCRPPG